MYKNTDHLLMLFLNCVKNIIFLFKTFVILREKHTVYGIFFITFLILREKHIQYTFFFLNNFIILREKKL